jgi:hypothetical protein
MDLMNLVEPRYSQKVKKSMVFLEKKEKTSEEENEAEEEAEEEEPEHDEELDKTEEPPPQIKLEPTGIVLGLVSSGLNSERDVIKKKFLEKINSLRAKRNAPLVNSISEIKESAAPPKKRKREKSTQRKRKRKKEENLRESGPEKSSGPEKESASGNESLRNSGMEKEILSEETSNNSKNMKPVNGSIPKPNVTTKTKKKEEKD